jgi:uncharacterized protein (DUF1697 family)
MTRVVALLRGINLGSRRRVAMADLRELVESLGYEDVRTHLQSGNVVFSSTDDPADAARALERAIGERLGLSVDVIVRTAAELDDVVAANPLEGVADDGSRYFVAFLSGDADGEAVEALTAEDFSPDQLRARGRELYAWCPDGMRDSRLMRTITRGRLAPTATVRNWNTVTKLLEIATSAE